jgi:hypothetical protein
VVNADKTRLAIWDPGVGKTNRAYIWAYARDELDAGRGVISYHGNYGRQSYDDEAREQRVDEVSRCGKLRESLLAKPAEETTYSWQAGGLAHRDNTGDNIMTQFGASSRYSDGINIAWFCQLVAKSRRQYAISGYLGQNSDPFAAAVSTILVGTRLRYCS